MIFEYEGDWCTLVEVPVEPCLNANSELHFLQATNPWYSLESNAAQTWVKSFQTSDLPWNSFKIYSPDSNFCEMENFEVSPDISYL